MTPMRPTSRRQAELDAWLHRAMDDNVIDLASMRGSMRAPTNLLQHLAEAVLDSNISVMPEGGLPDLRQNWADFEAQSRNRTIDHRAGMVVVKDPLAACAAAILGLVSPGRHVLVLEPLPPQVIDVIRRVGGMARSVSMRPTEWEFDPAEFAQRMGPQTDLIVVADPNPYSGQHLPEEARRAIIEAVAQTDCLVLVDESARHSVVEGETPETAGFFSALGDRCIRVDVPAAAVLAQAASAASITGHPDLIAPIRSAASAFGLHASEIAQSVLARRFSDGTAIDDAATLNGMIASGRALLLDGLDDIGVLGLGGPGGWYVPVRAKALYDGPHDIGDALVSRAGLAALPLAPFYAEGSADPYVLFAYLRDGNLLENSLQRLSVFSDDEAVRLKNLALPAPEEWGDDDADHDDSDEDDHDVDDVPGDEDFEEPQEDISEDVTPDGVADSDTDESEDAKYRAAMSEHFQTQTTESSEGMAETWESEGTGSEWANEAEEAVVLPFGRLRRGVGAPLKEAGTSDDGSASDTGKPEASVFKLSVPDIASPNIRAPESDSDDTNTAAEEDEQDTPDHVVAEPSSMPSEEAAPEPTEEERTENAENENADRVKREDRPFFFDDPMV